MDERLSLANEQALQQRLTPMQVQYVKLLEMNGPEVEEEIRRAVDDNPALTIAEDDHGSEWDGASGESAEEMQRADYRDEDDIPSYRLEARNHSPGERTLEPAMADDGETLMDYLMGQIAQTSLDDTDRNIAQYIIGNLDDNGYLSRDLPAISDDLLIMGVTRADIGHVKEVLNVVRSLDPAGVGAVDLRDCLLLQLRRASQPGKTAVDRKTVEVALEIITDYFDLFAKKHYSKLMSLMDISQEELKDAIHLISHLNPKPGSSVASSSTDDKSRQITPEFSVDIDGDQLVVTVLNSIPELQIEQSYAEATPLTQTGTPRQRREAALFVKQRRDEASNFIKIVEMRQTTLSRVMGAIVRLQRDFFLTGDVTQIHPMILKDVAALTGYDLSVISRATSGKYVMTQYGIFPIKMFFNERPKEDDDTSSHQIAASLKAIIDEEDKSHPLSDEAITAKMRDGGFDIARRTVAKYREKLGIPVARLRKEM